VSRLLARFHAPRPAALRRPIGRRAALGAGAGGILLAVTAVALVLTPGLVSSQGNSSAAASPSSAATRGTPWPEMPDLVTFPAVAQTPVPPEQLTGYIWPLADLRRLKITLPFGPVPNQWGDFVVDGQRFHDALDITTWCGDKVMAAHDGLVLAAGRRYDDYLGWQGSLAAYYQRLDEKKLWLDLPQVVVIDDGNGYRSIYAHLYLPQVKPGQRVKAGDLIGYESLTGRATGCHLHYGLYSPLETATLELAPDIAARMRLPSFETARVDPLRVLPYRHDMEEMRSLRPLDEAAWTPSPSPSPSPSRSPTPKASAVPSPTVSASPTPTLEPTPTAAATATPAATGAAALPGP
jgi:murein DD-endopeptidase MepM/ murein hydrolase activator NlpD